MNMPKKDNVDASIVRVFGFALVTAAISACSTAAAPVQSNCAASTRTVAGVVGTYCSYAVVVNGFRCPPNQPYRYEIERPGNTLVTICSNLEHQPIPVEACTNVSCAQGTDADVGNCEAAIDALYAGRSCDSSSMCFSRAVRAFCRSGMPTVVRQYAECFNTSPRPMCSFGAEDCILTVQAANWRSDITAARTVACTRCAGNEAELGSDFCNPDPTRTTAALTMFGTAQIEFLRQCATAAVTCGGVRACLDRLYAPNLEACMP